MCLLDLWCAKTLHEARPISWCHENGLAKHSRVKALSSWRHLTLEPLMPHKQQ